MLAWLEKPRRAIASSGMSVVLAGVSASARATLVPVTMICSKSLSCSSASCAITGRVVASATVTAAVSLFILIVRLLCS